MQFNEQEEEKKQLRRIVQEALTEFGKVQVNLSSESAREAIAVRIASDIASEYVLVPNERIEGDF